MTKQQNQTIYQMKHWIKTEAAARMFHIPFKKIWQEEQIAEDRKEGYLTRIPEKEGPNKYRDHRGITVLSVPGRV